MESARKRYFVHAGSANQLADLWRSYPLLAVDGDAAVADDDLVATLDRTLIDAVHLQVALHQRDVRTLSITEIPWLRRMR
jgi:hypothetical protein